ncbi:hypothetical protein [Azospirillum sp. SYSU D00513]|uniref:hypothetical protein n=1 Tax=Azospirillum sp. SYSU D00513 TaxID=2812561 RepID=UPI001A96534D|nr:hypothetical protein [Azospirillum sp. SYSU D00513]
MAVAFLAPSIAASGVPPALAQGDPMRVDRTDPAHLKAPLRGYDQPEHLEPRVRRTESRAVYSLPDGLDGLASYDKALSRLCQRGAFGQKVDGFYWARAKDRRYGVAFSGGANLLDPQNRRQPGKAYFIEGQDSRCKVYVGDQALLSKHYIAP